MNSRVGNYISMVTLKLATIFSNRTVLQNLRTKSYLKWGVTIWMLITEAAIVFMLSAALVDSSMAKLGLAMFFVLLVTGAVRFIPPLESNKNVQLVATIAFVLFGMLVAGGVAVKAFGDAGVFSSAVTSNVNSGSVLDVFKAYIFALKDALGPVVLMACYGVLTVAVHSWWHDASNSWSYYKDISANVERAEALNVSWTSAVNTVLNVYKPVSSASLKAYYKECLSICLETLIEVKKQYKRGGQFEFEADKHFPVVNEEWRSISALLVSIKSQDEINARIGKVKLALSQL